LIHYVILKCKLKFYKLDGAEPNRFRLNYFKERSYMLKHYLKTIIPVLFPSADMQRYLTDNAEILEKWQIIAMISGAPVPLKRKYEMFQKLAECENQQAELQSTEEGVTWKELYEDSYQYRVDILSKAFLALQNAEKEQGVFVLTEYEQTDRNVSRTEYNLFYDYKKLKKYLQERLAEMAEDSEGAENIWHEIEWYQDDGTGVLIKFYAYILLDGEPVYFLGNKEDDTKQCHPDLYDSGDLNLPVPFNAGDILQIDGSPFTEGKPVLVLFVGDNRDCCCVQVLYVSDTGRLEVGALKHGHHIYETDTYPVLSPLYRAVICQEKLKGQDVILEKIRDFMKGDERIGWYLMDCDGAYTDEITTEYLENCVAKEEKLKSTYETEETILAKEKKK